MTDRQNSTHNFNDSPIVATGVTMTVGTTAETVLAADTPSEDSKIERILISVTGFDAFIRFMPAATLPNTRKGVFMIKDGPPLEIIRDNLYPGEISIINAQGGQTPTYFVTVY